MIKNIKNSVSDFLIYNKNQKHSAIGVIPNQIMKNANDEQSNLKVKLKTETKSRKKKMIAENYE